MQQLLDLGVINILFTWFEQCNIFVKYNIVYALLSHVYYSPDEQIIASID